MCTCWVHIITNFGRVTDGQGYMEAKRSIPKFPALGKRSLRNGRSSPDRETTWGHEMFCQYFVILVCRHLCSHIYTTVLIKWMHVWYMHPYLQSTAAGWTLVHTSRIEWTFLKDSKYPPPRDDVSVVEFFRNLYDNMIYHHNITQCTYQLLGASFSKKCPRDVRGVSA
jgi:hypothetical protein